MNNCACGSNKEYSECCGPLIAGVKIAATPEELMRSRYVAYVEKNIDYVLKTTHPETVGELKRDELQEWADNTVWDRLQINSSDTATGVVDFVAYYRESDTVVSHHELAQFKQVEDKWYFYDAQFPKTETIVNNQPKVGRNEQCPCGSGKKYKKCCGKK